MRSRLPGFSFLGLVCLVAGCAASPAPVAAPTKADPSSAAGAPSCGAPADGVDAMTDDQLARKILEMTGATRLMRQVGDKMLDSFQKMPNLPPGFLERFKAELNVDELVDDTVQIYKRHLGHAEMVAAVRFYGTPEGKALVAALPSMTEESMEHGKRWGEALAKKVLREVGAGAP